jgi:Mrp family chromosome partitioning ATPase
MEMNRITLPPMSAVGEVTTFYSYENGTARSVVLSHMAALLAGRQNASVPVLMIDWDLGAPGLHHLFGIDGEGPGLLEYLAALRARLALAKSGVDDLARARQALAAVDWQLYVERVDQARPLYLMRAGRFDDSYGERADAMDWDGLFRACPVLYRSLGEYLAQQFRYVLVDAPSGRSGAVSVCTALLPDRLVGLFTPNQRSLDGLAGVVERAIEYRCSHEEEQRPLLVYPLPALADGADGQRRLAWRRGDPYTGVPGYQSALERLLGRAYALSALSLDSYLDEVQLQHSQAVISGEPLAAPGLRDGDRFSLARTCETLLDWVADGYFPWQSHAEVRQLDAVKAARARLEAAGADGADAGMAEALPLARELFRLGTLYRAQGRAALALDCFDECTRLRARLLGDDHADTRASRAGQAAQLAALGRLGEAAFVYEQLLDDTVRRVGDEHAEALAARAGLAATLAQQGQFARALALHEELVACCERLYGAGHADTLAALAGQARSLQRQGELARARMLYERVLDGRERLLGSEHADTLQCRERLARLLCALGDFDHARGLQESVVGAHERQAGVDHPVTLRAREVLAEILVAHGDLGAVARVQQALARARERALGADHPATLAAQLQLAATLGQQDDLDAAGHLQQRVVRLHEQVHGSDHPLTLRSQQLLATTLSRQGHSGAARSLEQRVLHGAERLRMGMAAGPHPSHLGALGRTGGPRGAREADGGADTLGQKLTELQQLIDSRSEREARELADSLRSSVLRPSVAHPLRRRGVMIIRQAYAHDKDALLAFAQDEVSSLEGRLGGGATA